MTLDNTRLGLVQSLQAVINAYGLDAVKHTVQFIEKFPASPKMYVFKSLWYHDMNQNYVPEKSWELTQAEFDRVSEEWRSGNKIRTIKIFRDITKCGLKEAKDAIETFDWSGV